ncbi:MAG: Modification methylase DpnIIB [Deltaproteobacteria bacterium ADurb.Bin135]|nr:MAG: Modification methylase DpnIIB [Deltaproteobacteria bacterium ADurb.Bin135]
MARKKIIEQNQKPLEQYEHKDKQRLNNPPVGLVDAHTDNGGQRKKTYQYDPHLDPQLQWAGKAEHTSFDVPTVSLHVHERIDPRRIMESVRKEKTGPQQMSLFEEDKKPLREAIEFYKHKENWSNRLIAGDSLLIMNSLLEKEGMGGKVQMIYFDPPYGIKYGSNFQPFVNKRDVKDGKDEDLTAEPEMIKAFRDTWELGIHSYLAYLRDRLLLAKELLSESGSVFVQISDENVHLVRCLMDEVMGGANFCGQIVFIKTAALTGNLLSSNYDYLLWFSRDIAKIKYRQLFLPKKERTELGTFSWIELNDGTCRKLSVSEMRGEIDVPEGKRFRAADISGQGETASGSFPFEYEGKTFYPSQGRHWTTSKEGMEMLKNRSRIISQGNTLAYKRYENDFPVMPLVNVWDDTIIGTFTQKIYVVQTGDLAISRCLLMTTDPGDLVLDITCGSGTTAHVAENWGRRWITCDTSRVAIALAKQRLMTANFDYFQLAHPDEGVGSGFKYKTVPHITLKSIANNEPAPQETLYDQPFIDNKRLRVTGPFTVEAVPAPTVVFSNEFSVFSEEENSENSKLITQNFSSDISVARSGETLRQSEWRDELLRAGVRAKGGKLIEFTRMEPLSGTRYLQAEAETKEDDPKRVLVCFGPEHAPLEPRMVDLAMEEAEHLKPKAHIILFCAFQFDEEASKDIDETNWPGMTILKAQMNADLLTDDLKKKRASNESFWLIGQPDVSMKAIESGSDKGKYQVEVQGFDYYNPKTGTVESGGKGDIAMWMLDIDYDGRSLFPSQVFFPMAGAKEGWATLSRNLKAEIDEEKIEVFGGTVSLPFTPGKAVAIKIIDARGIESLKIIRL